MSSSVVAARSERIVGRRLPLAALIGGGISVVANVVLFFIVEALGVDMTGPFMGPDGPTVPLSPVQVAIVSFFPAFVGAALLWVLNRFTPRPITIFIAIAAIFTLLSIGAPATLPVASNLQVALGLMHIVSAVAITWALVTRTRE